MSISLSPMLNTISISDNIKSPVLVWPGKGKMKVSVNPNFSKTLITVHDDFENDEQIVERLTNYFYYKTLDKWLYDDLMDILNYFKVAGGKVKLTQYKAGAVDKDSDAVIEKKIKYIEDNILTKKIMRNFINRFVEEYNLTWTRTLKKQRSLKLYLKEVIAKMLKKLAKEGF